MDDEAIRKDVVARRWVHSHEEDTDTEMVFRPAGYKFPPSRGRSSFELRADGSLLESGPGPTDRTETGEGKWSLDANKDLVFYQGSQKQPSRVLKVASIDSNRLVVKKQ